MCQKTDMLEGIRNAESASDVAAILVKAEKELLKV
jgi:hypothetical protein